jgi:LysM repeat protein
MENLGKLSEWLYSRGHEKEASMALALVKAAGKTVTYKVRSGDVLGKIAEMFDISVEELRSENNLKNDNIQIGQTLKVPASKTSSVHVVESGNTLSGIAENYGVSIGDILKKNNIGENDTLSVGQELRVPTAASIEAKRKAAEEKHIRKWSGSDDELLAMTLLGEGGTLDDSGIKSMKEVLTVILNRMKHGGSSLRDIVFAPSQFEFWMKYKPDDIHSGAAWGKSHPRWKEALAIAGSRAKDPHVKFSTHYWNPEAATPSWRDKILVVHKSKHVYGVLPDESKIWKKVYAENKEAIDKLKKYDGS